MPSFSAGDIVRVPFPYTNRETTQKRPAMVVSDGALGDGLLLWVLMITSAANRGWPGDVPLASAPAETGLQADSLVRTMKVATIEAAIAEKIGHVDGETLAAVRIQLGHHLGLADPTPLP